MEITKKKLMCTYTDDNQETHDFECWEDEIYKKFEEVGYAVVIVGHYEVKFTDDIQEYIDKIAKLEEQVLDLKDRLDNIKDYMCSAKNYLEDYALDYINSAEDEADY